MDKNIFAIMNEGQGEKVRFSTTDSQIVIYNAISSKGVALSKRLDEEFEVTDIVVTSSDVHSDIRDENSEIISIPVVHFFTTDKQHIATISKGVCEAIEGLAVCAMLPTPEKPITVKFVKVMGAITMEVISI